MAVACSAELKPTRMCWQSVAYLCRRSLAFADRLFWMRMSSWALLICMMMSAMCCTSELEMPPPSMSRTYNPLDDTSCVIMTSVCSFIMTAQLTLMNGESGHKVLKGDLNYAEPAWTRARLLSLTRNTIQRGQVIRCCQSSTCQISWCAPLRPNTSALVCPSGQSSCKAEVHWSVCSGSLFSFLQPSLGKA